MAAGVASQIRMEDVRQFFDAIDEPWPGASPGGIRVHGVDLDIRGQNARAT